MNLENCKTCKEKRCQLAFLQITEKQIELNKVKKILIKDKMNKLKKYTIKEKKYWNNFKNREMSLINYNRKPHMNKSDWIHDSNWFIAIQALMTLDERHYNTLSELYRELINL